MGISSEFKLKGKEAQALKTPDGNTVLGVVGHQDVIRRLFISGTIDKFIDRGVDYLIHANIQNVGGTIDEALLGHFAALCEEAKSKGDPVPFGLMEVGENRGEKGGVLGIVNKVVRTVERHAFGGRSMGKYGTKRDNQHTKDHSDHYPFHIRIDTRRGNCCGCFRHEAAYKAIGYAYPVVNPILLKC